MLTTDLPSPIEILAGNADVSDNYRYRVVSRVRPKLELLEKDVKILNENPEVLMDRLRDIVCGDSDRNHE